MQTIFLKKKKKRERKMCQRQLPLEVTLMAQGSIRMAHPIRDTCLLSLEGDSQPYLSMLMAQRFRMLAVHIMTSRVTKTSQQMRLKFQTPPVTWALETRRRLVFSPGKEQ